MSVVFIVLAFIVGAFIGLFVTEFLSQKMHKSHFSAPLKCATCQVDFRKEDRIPVYRFIKAKFRCRHCSSKLNWKYFFIEILSGFALAATVSQVLSGEYSIFKGIILFATLMTLIEFLLLRNLKLLKEKTLLTAIPFLAVAAFILTGSLYLPVVGGLIMGSFFTFQHIISKDWIDYEEVLIGILSGIVLGVLPGFIALIMAILITSAVAVFVVLAQRRKLHDEALFAEALLFATLLTLALKDTVINWYFNII